MKITEFDTTDTVIRKIAQELKTAPKFLIIENPETIMTDVQNGVPVHNRVINLVEEMSKHKTLEQFYTYLISVPVKNPNLMKELLSLWLWKKHGNIQDENMQDAIYGKYRPFLNTLFDNTEISTIENTESTNATLEMEIDINERIIRRAEETTRILSETEGFEITDIRPETVEYNISVKTHSLLSCFNNLCTNRQIPFVTYGNSAENKNYYKIFKPFIPMSDWIETTPDTIVLKRHIAKSSTPEALPSGTFQNLYVTEENSQVSVNLTIDPTVEDTVYTEIETTLGTTLDTKNPEQLAITANIYYPQAIMDTYVLSDVIMTTFFQQITLIEFPKVSKKKGDGPHSLQIHFFTPETGEISANISQRVVNRSEKIFSHTKEDVFPDGTPCIKIRVKGSTLKSLEYFQKIMSKILAYAFLATDEITEIYQEFIPDFTIQEPPIKLTKDSSGLDSEIFVSKYTRCCPTERLPKVVPEKVRKTYTGQMMTFPRVGDFKKTQYNSDNLNPKVYGCDHNAEHKFPGIQVNTLTNLAKYPYLPCCFAKDQNVKGSEYRKYFFEEETGKKQVKQQGPTITEKILEDGNTGVLPPIIARLFGALNIPDCLRLGVKKYNPSSFLACVLKALGKDTENIEEIRKELADSPHLPVARQSCYEFSLRAIQDILIRTDEYLSPVLFAEFLERVYNCRILLFSATGPLNIVYREGHYEYNQVRSKLPTVLILEHYGSEKDTRAMSRPPQCELIIGKSNTYPQSLYNIFDTMRIGYILNNKIEPVKFPHDLIESQYIDFMGKARRVIVSGIDFHTSPLPPNSVPIITEDNRPIITGYAHVEKFMEENDGQITDVFVEHNKIREIRGFIGNVEVTTCVDGDISRLQDNIRISEVAWINTKKHESSLAVYSRNQRFARYLVDYSLWLFSRFLKEEKINVIYESTLELFASRTFVYDSDIKYEFTSSFYDQNPEVYNGGNLILQSEKVGKRLLFTIRMFSMRNKDALLRYGDYTQIQKYYLNLDDFTQYDSEILLEGESSVFARIEEKSQSYKIRSQIDSIILRPYFYLDRDKNIYLAQNCSDLASALTIGRIWQQEGYNPSIYVKPKMDENHGYVMDVYNEGILQSRVTRDGPNLIRLAKNTVANTEYFTVLMKV